MARYWRPVFGPITRTILICWISWFATSTYRTTASVTGSASQRYRSSMCRPPSKCWSRPSGFGQVCANHYRLNLDALTTVEDLATACDMTPSTAQHTLRYMLDVPWYGGCKGGGDKPIESIAARETVLKHTTFLSVIEEVLSWNSIGPPYGDAPSQVTIRQTEPPPEPERLAPALPEWLTKLPDTAQVLMREVHVAMHEDLYALSAMGIRAVVDVISVDLLAGDAGSFNAKVDGLAKAGHLSPSQRTALNAVVDAGHAAAHRGLVPTRDAAQEMLDALEVVLKTAYVLPGVAQSLQAMTPKRPPKSKV